MNIGFFPKTKQPGRITTLLSVKYDFEFWSANEILDCKCINGLLCIAGLLLVFYDW